MLVLDSSHQRVWGFDLVGVRVGANGADKVAICRGAIPSEGSPSAFNERYFDPTPRGVQREVPALLDRGPDVHGSSHKAPFSPQRPFCVDDRNGD